MLILLLLLSVASVVVMLSMPTQILTCQFNPGQDSVQCEANRIRWWRSQTQFHLPQVQQATLGSRQVTVYLGRRTTDYYMTLEVPSGQPQIFPARTPDLTTDLVTQERQIAHLNLYLASPQPAPWVYRFPSRLTNIVTGAVTGAMLLCLVGIATLWLQKPNPYMIELDRTPGRMVVTSRYLNGRQHFATYRLDNIARVWVEESRGAYGGVGYNTWVLLISGIQIDLIGNWHSGVEQHRAAELIKQFLRH